MPSPITLTSPVPAGDPLFESMFASAGLSMLGESQLKLLSLKPDITPEDLLGKASNDVAVKGSRVGIS